MGIHFLDVSAVGPELDPARPQILLYEPSEDGLRLIGVEWFVPLATGAKNRRAVRPRVPRSDAGTSPADANELAHYDLHIWLFKPNPLGTFSPTNPEVTCEGADHLLEEKAPELVEHAVGE